MTHGYQLEDDYDFRGTVLRLKHLANLALFDCRYAVMLFEHPNHLESVPLFPDFKAENWKNFFIMRGQRVREEYIEKIKSYGLPDNKARSNDFSLQYKEGSNPISNSITDKRMPVIFTYSVYEDSFIIETKYLDGDLARLPIKKRFNECEDGLKEFFTDRIQWVINLNSNDTNKGAWARSFMGKNELERTIVRRINGDKVDILNMLPAWDINHYI